MSAVLFVWPAPEGVSQSLLCVGVTPSNSFLPLWRETSSARDIYLQRSFQAFNIIHRHSLRAHAYRTKYKVNSVSHFGQRALCWTGCSINSIFGNLASFKFLSSDLRRPTPHSGFRRYKRGRLWRKVQWLQDASLNRCLLPLTMSVLSVHPSSRLAIPQLRFKRPSILCVIASQFLQSVICDRKKQRGAYQGRCGCHRPMLPIRISVWSSSSTLKRC